MIFALLVLIFFMLSALSLATVVQVCFLESMRLRPREYDTLRVFDESVESALEVPGDTGALTFSLWKHTLLVLLAVPLYSIVQSPWEATIYAVILMLGAAYLVPQFLYRRTSGRWMVRALPLLRLMIKMAKPLISLLSGIRAVAEMAGEDESGEKNGQEEHEIEALIEAGAEEGLIEEGDKKLIKTVIEFGDKTVREVMTPRGNIVAISQDKTLEELRQLVISEKFSRIPVYQDSLDNITGFVHVRDMFEIDCADREQKTIRSIMRGIDAVPESKRIEALLREMQTHGNHMVVVVDEYGQTAGIVTMEDLVEEILGEIRDEHEPAQDVQQENNGSYVLSGSYDLDHLYELVEFRRPEDTEATTVGGLVTEWMGRVPQAGEAIERDGIRIEVLASSDLRVDKVRLYKVARAPESEEANA